MRVDMEDSSCTADALRIYRKLRERGYDNVKGKSGLVEFVIPGWKG